MALTKLLITHDEGATDQTRKMLGANPSDALAGMVHLQRYLNGVAGGIQKAKLAFGVAAVQASATATLASTVATNTIVIGGITFTAVSSGASGNQFNVGVDDPTTATNLANVINANTTLANILSASAASAVVTITALTPGLHGNAITLAQSGGTITLSAAALAGGSEGTAYTYLRGGAT